MHATLVLLLTEIVQVSNALIGIARANNAVCQPTPVSFEKVEVASKIAVAIPQATRMCPTFT